MYKETTTGGPHTGDAGQPPNLPPARPRDPLRCRRPLPLLGDGDGSQDRPAVWPTRGTRAEPRADAGDRPVSLAALKRREAHLVGGFSETSTMPWLSWSTP